MTFTPILFCQIMLGEKNGDSIEVVPLQVIKNENVWHLSNEHQLHNYTDSTYWDHWKPKTIVYLTECKWIFVILKDSVQCTNTRHMVIEEEKKCVTVCLEFRFLCRIVRNNLLKKHSTFRMCECYHFQFILPFGFFHSSEQQFFVIHIDSYN